MAVVMQIITRVKYPESHQELSEEDLKDFKLSRYGNLDSMMITKICFSTIYVIRHYQEFKYLEVDQCFSGFH